MPDSVVEMVLAGSGIDHESSVGARIFQFAALLVKWNSRINLISSTRPAVLVPLIQEAIWAAKRYPTNSSVHLDIGSGAGFPAIPLAIMHPGVEVAMLEGRAKKAAFLQTVAHDLQLGNVRVANQRLDEFLRVSPTPGPWQCISWKAVRLSTRDFSRLLAATAENTRFWLFHGAELPIENSTLIAESLDLRNREECPFHPGWFLSEFRRKTVSRETG